MFKETSITKSATIIVDSEELGSIKVESHKNGETYCLIDFTIGYGFVSCFTEPENKIRLTYQEEKDILCKELEFAAKGILSLVEFINSACPQLPTKPEPKSKEEEINDILERTNNLSPEESC